MNAIDKALDILEKINSNEVEISLAELARLTKSNRPTVYRICSTLVKRGYLNQKQKRGKYSLGYKFLQYYNRKNIVTRIKDNSASFLQKLCKDTSENVILAILEDNFATNVVNVLTESLLQVSPKLESKLPLHCTAPGKVLLAYLEKERQEKIIDSMQFTGNTANTIIDAASLKKNIEKIIIEGVAFDNEEYALGIRSIASPIRDETGEVIAAVSLIGPSIRLNKTKLIHFAKLVKQCASSISMSLGYAENQ